MKFYAKGKLLLTAEYAVLGGAKALGLPTKLGQSLDVTKTTKAKIEWKSIDVNGQVWYENSFDKTTFATKQKNDAIGQRIQQLLRAIKELNPKIWSEINGEMRQQGNTADMVFNVKQIVSHLSQFMTLNPGDIIFTGTPEGVGDGMTPPSYLKPGDIVRVGISGLGAQRQSIVAAE